MKDNMRVRKKIVDGITVAILTVLAFVFMTPIAVVIMNSFKNKQSLIRGRGKAFDLLNKDSWYGFKNYTEDYGCNEEFIYDNYCCSYYSYSSYINDSLVYSKSKK